MVPEQCKPQHPKAALAEFLTQNDLVCFKTEASEVPPELSQTSLHCALVTVEKEPEWAKLIGEQFGTTSWPVFLRAGKLVEISSLVSQNPAKPTLEDRLKALINSHEVMLFMKGSPENPQCGFSGKTIKLIEKYRGRTEYRTFNIFED